MATVLTQVGEARGGGSGANGMVPLFVPRSVNPPGSTRGINVLHYLADRLRLGEVQQNGYFADVWDDSSGALKILGEGFTLAPFPGSPTPIAAYNATWGITKLFQIREDNMASMDDLKLDIPAPDIPSGFSHVITCYTVAGRTFLLAYDRTSGMIMTFLLQVVEEHCVGADGRLVTVRTYKWLAGTEPLPPIAGASAIAYLPDRQSVNQNVGYLTLLVGRDLHVYITMVGTDASGGEAIGVTKQDLVPNWVERDAQLVAIDSGGIVRLLTYEMSTGVVVAGRFTARPSREWRGMWPTDALVGAYRNHVVRYGLSDGVITDFEVT